MEYRLPELTDKELLNDYIKEHLSNGETSISASTGLLSTDFDVWVKQIHINELQGNELFGISSLYLCFDEDELIGLLSVRYDLPKEKRGIYPKKEHSGYLLIYSNPVDYRYNFRGIHKKAQLYQTVFQTPYTIDVRYEDAYVGVKDDLTKEVYDDESLLDKLGGYYFWPDDIYEDIIKTNIKEAQNNYYDYLIEDFIDKNNREPYYSEKDEMKGLSSDYDTDYFFNMNLRINGKEGYWEVMIWHNFPINEAPSIMRLKKGKKDDRKDEKV